ncbi:histidine phosphatase family protein [Ectothiorhodospiraceae bacterium WFHF3C12]|nr:histidine phosphatase family protein [Ectothiorhodospiraceae bacterium WFHF3C12]
MLIRHGQASFGSDNYDQLSDLGHRQSRITGEHLAGLGRLPDVMISGELERQKDTAIGAQGQWDGHDADLEIADAFNEYDADGLFKAYLPAALREDAELAEAGQRLFQDRRLFQRAFSRIVRAWLSEEPHDAGDVEGWSAFRGRVQDGLERLRSNYDRDARIALFTSGGPIAVAVGEALGLSPSATIELNWVLFNASITELRSTKTGWRLMGFNNVTHLELVGEPGLVTSR